MRNKKSPEEIYIFLDATKKLIYTSPKGDAILSKISRKLFPLGEFSEYVLLLKYKTICDYRWF